MDGPTFIEEGVVAVQKIGDAMYGLYTRSLNTDVSDIHYSVVAGYLKNILFFPTSATSAKNVMDVRHLLRYRYIVCRRCRILFPCVQQDKK